MSSSEAAEAALSALLDQLTVRPVKKPEPIVAPTSKLMWMRFERDTEGMLKGRDIIRAVLYVTGVREVDFMSPRRAVQYVEARHIAFWFMRHFTQMSYPQIGRMVGMRDHSTVVHGVWKVSDPKNHDRFASKLEGVAAVLGIELPAEVPFQ